ncbi:hypothetical protein [Pyruvatibacter sp.]
MTLDTPSIPFVPASDSSHEPNLNENDHPAASSPGVLLYLHPKTTKPRLSADLCIVLARIGPTWGWWVQYNMFIKNTFRKELIHVAL